MAKARPTGVYAGFAALPVWPDLPPGGIPQGLTEQEIPRSPTGPADDTAFLHVTRPTLLHCPPRKANGASILLVPGGSYMRVAIGHGGGALLRAFADQGYSAYLLKYRLPGDGWQAGPDAPLQDAQRALRLIRARARRHGLDPARLAVWGGSAGGHLAARLVNTPAAAYAAVDATDAEPLGVKAAILLYPVNLMSGPHAHAPSRKELIAGRPGADPDSLSAQAGISASSPPTFLSHAFDDSVVPAENTLSYLTALRRAQVPCEVLIKETGGHGFAWSDPQGKPMAWTAPALHFLHRHGA
jgi:acetyl esterase/lipase